MLLVISIRNVISSYDKLPALHSKLFNLEERSTYISLKSLDDENILKLLEYKLNINSIPITYLDQILHIIQ